MGAAKNVLMVARNNKVEALRMASGLTLLDDVVSVVVCGPLEQSEAVDEQLETLDFSDVTVHRLGEHLDELAPYIAAASVVYFV